MNIAEDTVQDVDTRKRKGKLVSKVITLAHGGGGKAMRDLIDDVFVQAFSNPALNTLEDQARFNLSDLAIYGDRLAMTTDSYVIDPIFFPGGLPSSAATRVARATAARRRGWSTITFPLEACSSRQ